MAGQSPSVGTLPRISQHFVAYNAPAFAGAHTGMRATAAMLFEWPFIHPPCAALLRPNGLWAGRQITVQPYRPLAL